MPGGCSPDSNSPKSTILESLIEFGASLPSLAVGPSDLARHTSDIGNETAMTEVIDISVELTQLADFAEREDWFYLAELKLADEFSVVARAFAEANPGAYVICKNYIGGDSALRYSARSTILRSIKSIERSLDKLQGKSATYNLQNIYTDYFSRPNPAQTFFQYEIRRRNLNAY